MIGPVPTGLGTYASGLVRALTTIDRENSYVVIRGSDGESPIDPRATNVAEVVLRGELDTPRNLAHGGPISRLKLDLYHSLHHFLPYRLHVPQVVVTLHDLIWIEHASLIKAGRFAGIHNAVTHVFARIAMRHAVTRADRVIAVSRHTADRAAAYYRIDRRRVAVVHHGVNHQAFPFQAPVPIAISPYFLVVGNTRPYKNVATAVRAFAICARRFPGTRLVIIGRGDSIPTLAPLARALGVSDRVELKGPLAHREVLDLLHHATALLFPSLVEGFGFPVLEAMAAGCPVIGSRIPTVCEIAGQGAVFCDPASPTEFAEAMERMLEDDAWRGELARRGCERAARFSWEKCAAETLAVYQELLEGR
jgi:glycosyltransferase involved in cell wall biosynthesis